MGVATIEQASQGHIQEQALDQREKELREVVERVYRRYGANLSAFYRDARRESQKELDKKSS